MRSPTSAAIFRMAAFFVLSGCGLVGGDNDYASINDLDSLTDDLQALAERIAVVENGDSDEDLEPRISVIEDELVTIQSDLDDIDSDLTRVFDSIDSLEDAIADLPTGSTGGAWWTSGSGTGTCAFLTVTTTSAEPVFATATVNASYLQGYGQSSGGAVSASLTAASSDGAWTDYGISAATNLTVNIPDLNYNYTYTYTNYVVTSAVMPLTWVFEIPRAGTYILRLEVGTTATGSSSTGSGSATASDCTLLAWQVG